MVVNMDRVGLYVIFPLHDAEWSVLQETVLRWASSEVFFILFLRWEGRALYRHMPISKCQSETPNSVLHWVLLLELPLNCACVLIT